ncbi:hypothetical protein LVJ94_06885 [Pendulispora rubella]|uniref:Lipoprotein n=1 Tax=Pendulispora rubella TaxID=2741070 RepID=A0ABZ2LAZ8_9BACT
MRITRLLASLAFVSLTLPACASKTGNDEALSQSEALEAVEESSLSSQANNLTSASIEIATNFTIGGAVEAAATQLRTFIATQLPCAETTLVGSTLSITYGARPGSCVYRGHTFSGKSQVKVTRNDAGSIVVDHTWTDFSNGIVKVNGTAEVTWNTATPTRRVAHDVTWTRISDGRSGHGTGNRTQTALAGDIAAGFTDSGTLGWTGPHGRWDLSIQGVEMRWKDPVPQAGTYVLETPKDKTLTVTYSRVDADSIKVTATANGHSFSFDVNALGVHAR